MQPDQLLPGSLERLEVRRKLDLLYQIKASLHGVIGRSLPIKNGRIKP